jgi:hypothetical protein
MVAPESFGNETGKRTERDSFLYRVNPQFVELGIERAAGVLGFKEFRDSWSKPFPRIFAVVVLNREGLVVEGEEIATGGDAPLGEGGVSDGLHGVLDHVGVAAMCDAPDESSAAGHGKGVIMHFAGIDLAAGDGDEAGKFSRLGSEALRKELLALCRFGFVQRAGRVCRLGREPGRAKQTECDQGNPERHSVRAYGRMITISSECSVRIEVTDDLLVE